jgi:hypothetical protein
MTYRNRLIRPSALALKALYDKARADLSAMNFRHECRIADLRHELNETRAAFEELRAAVLARQNAEHALASLYRERAIARARAATRDASAPLH